MLRFHLIGDWPPGAVRTAWVPSTHRLEPEMLPEVDRIWQRVSTRPGVHLFDGPMCRLESFAQRGGELHLAFSPTSYRIFLGTNLHHAEWAQRGGWGILANPMGVSTALVSSDDRLLMGRRNAAVAYYPERVHPFAGALEPRQPLDVFDEVRRELREELGLVPADLGDMRCVALAEDVALRQPELIFIVAANRPAGAIAAGLDAAEHRAAWSVPIARPGMEQALGQTELLTPVAVSVLLMLGRQRFGADWFDQQRARLPAAG